jgi:hypothetical protein
MAWGTAPHLCCAIATADYRSSQISARSGVARKAAACQVDVIVILDRKTPAAAFDRCMSLASRGLSIACPSLQEQERFLRKVGFPSERIPYDSDNRRNGYLMALHGSTEFLISIDDDNFSPFDEENSQNTRAASRRDPQLLLFAYGWAAFRYARRPLRRYFLWLFQPSVRAKTG